MAKNKDAGLKGVLKIPIGASRSGPTKRLIADLHSRAECVAHVKNTAMFAWLRWREDHDWQPAPQLSKSGKPLVTKRGLPVVGKMDFAPRRVTEAGEPLPDDSEDGFTFSTYLYHVCRKQEPTLAACVVSCAVRDVLSNLATKEVSRHGGLYQFRWQAILARAAQIPTFFPTTITAKSDASGFCYLGDIAGNKKSKDLKQHGMSGAAFSTALFSGAAGRENQSPIFMLNVGPLSPGNRAILRRVARREWKLCDSELVLTDDKWFLAMVYEQPGQSLGLDEKRTATIWACPKSESRPFIIECADARPWQCGNGRWLAAEYDRLEARRKGIRSRYKEALSGVKGHGRKRFEMRLKPWARATKNCQRHFVNQVVSEFIRYCERNNCGTVLYREPKTSTRPFLWLAKHEAPFDWTTLATALSHKCRYYGIKLVIERARKQEIDERFGVPKVAATG